jgi:hypothetical protein
MEDLRILDWIYGGLLMALGALWTLIRETLKDQRAAHERLNEKVDTLRNEVSKDYIPRKEVAVLMGEIKGSLQRIEDKLNEKVDKK